MVQTICPSAPNVKPESVGRPQTLRTVLFALCVFIGALGTREAYLLIVRPDYAAYPDTQHIERIAWRLAQNAGYDDPYESPPAIYRPPLSPFLISLVYRLVGRVPAAFQHVQAVIGAIGAVCLYSCAVLLFSRRAGLIAGLGASIYPYFVYLTGVFYPEAIGVPLFSGCTLLFVIASRGDRFNMLSMGCLGVALGLCALCRPNWLLSAALLIPAVCLSRYLSHRRITAWPVVVSVVAWATVWTPWTIRNLRTYQAPILITASGGYNFYLGNAPDATWDSKTAVSLPPDYPGSEGIIASSEVSQIEREWYRLGWDRVREQPFRAVVLWAGKLLHLWQPLPSIKHHRVASGQLVLACVSYAVLLMAGLVGIIAQTRARIWELPLLLSVAVVDSCLVAVFITPVRLRLPFDAILILAASAPIAALAGATVARLRKAPRLNV